MRRAFKLYHGTIRAFADKIIEERKFTFKQRKNHWLGNGVYFFVDDPEQAKIWAGICRQNAKAKSRREKLEKSVIEVDYEVDKSKYLNLDSRTDRIRLESFIKDLPKDMNIEGNQYHHAMCLVMDFFVEYYDVQAAKYTFTNKNGESDVLKNLGIENHGEQFCIYDSTTIDFSKVKQKEVV